MQRLLKQQKQENGKCSRNHSFLTCPVRSCISYVKKCVAGWFFKDPNPNLHLQLNPSFFIQIMFQLRCSWPSKGYLQELKNKFELGTLCARNIAKSDFKSNQAVCARLWKNVWKLKNLRQNSIGTMHILRPGFQSLASVAIQNLDKHLCSFQYFRQPL